MTMPHRLSFLAGGFIAVAAVVALAEPASANLDQLHGLKIGLTTRPDAIRLLGVPAQERKAGDHTFCVWEDGTRRVTLEFSKLDILVGQKIEKKQKP
ncbi:MAG: hypothetical protein ABSH53_14790 [Holophaga sp.]|jgi:hypothetical protein